MSFRSFGVTPFRSIQRYIIELQSAPWFLWNNLYFLDLVDLLQNLLLVAGLLGSRRSPPMAGNVLRVEVVLAGEPWVQDSSNDTTNIEKPEIQLGAKNWADENLLVILLVKRDGNQDSNQPMIWASFELGYGRKTSPSRNFHQHRVQLQVLLLAHVRRLVRFEWFIKMGTCAKVELYGGAVDFFQFHQTSTRGLANDKWTKVWQVLSVHQLLPKEPFFIDVRFCKYQICRRCT